MMTNYDTENGGLGVFPGSHLRGPQKDVGTLEGIHHCDQVFIFSHLNGKTMQQFVQYLKVECDQVGKLHSQE